MVKRIPRRTFSSLLLTMAAESLSPEIVKFIKGYIHSVEELEILCVFSEEQTRCWSVPQVFQRIQSSEKSIASRLEIFKNEGLLVTESEGTYRLSSNDPNLVQTLKAVITAYRDRRVSVIECIYKPPSGPIQDFADAFKLRKKK
jgi:hypothetical protein